MAINVLRIDLAGRNPSPLLDPLIFQITLECIQPLADEWRLTYVGSAESEKYDQILDSIMVGPMTVGMSRFVLEAPGPDPALIPPKDAIGITCVLLIGLYRGKEFIRVGYFVNLEYDNPDLTANPPDVPIFQMIIRSILIDKPRVTRYAIDWTGEEGSNMLAIPMETSSSTREEEMQLERSSSASFNQSNQLKRNDGVDFTNILTPKLALFIFQQLEIHQLGRCTGVSKEWRRIIENGVNWTLIDLSEIDWAGYTEKEKLSLIDFVIGQTSPQIEELGLSNCEGINDALLYKWLNKCGKSLRILDLDWCIKLTPRAVDIIVETCPEELSMIRDKQSAIEFTENVKTIATKYQNQLKELSFSGVNQAGLALLSGTPLQIAPLTLLDCLGASLKYLSIPFSSVLDNDVTNFLKKCLVLEHLGLEMCSNVTTNLIQELRASTNLEVKASHTRQDFSVELTHGDEDGDTIISVRLKDWPDDVDVISVVRPLLPEGVTFHTDVLRFYAEPSKVLEVFTQAEFDDVVIKEEDGDVEDESGEEMIPCAVCKEPSLEDELLTCDECESSFHLDCLDPTPQNIEGNWLCEECKTGHHGGGEEEDLEGHSRKKRRV